MIRLVDGQIVEDAPSHADGRVGPMPRRPGGSGYGGRSGERPVRREVLRFALRGLAANKLRSGLTMLGILIGVGAVILLVAVGNGSSKQVQKNIERLGTNTLTVTPSTSGRRARGRRRRAAVRRRRRCGANSRPGRYAGA